MWGVLGLWGQEIVDGCVRVVVIQHSACLLSIDEARQGCRLRPFQ